MTSTSWPTGLPEPRIHTKRRTDLRPQSLGHLTARWHRLVLRHPLMAWQRLAADLFGELDAETGLRHYDAALLKVPRQQGKTWWLRADMLGNSRRPNLQYVERKLWLPSDRPWIDAAAGVDELPGLWLPRRDDRDVIESPPRRIVAYTAQDRGKAREQIVTELIDQDLAGCRPLSGRYVPRRAQGSERVTWRDTGGRIQVESSNETAAHGLTLDDAVLDEAFAHPDLTIVNAIEPTMLTKADPQIKIVSTPGEGDDGLLLHYEEIAAIAVHDPDTTFAVLDWSATADEDRTDPAVWRRRMPALGHTITEQRIRQLLGRTPPAEFDRAYLARRPAVDVAAALDVAGWAQCANTTDTELELAGAITLSIELNPDRSSGVVAAAGQTAGGALAVVVDVNPGTRWIAKAVQTIVQRHGTSVVDVWADRRSGLGGVIDELGGHGVVVYEVNAGDVASAAGTLYDLTELGVVGLLHDAQPELDAAVRGSRRRPIGDAWTFDKLRSVADVAPAAGAALAVAAFLRHFPAGVGLGGIR